MSADRDAMPVGAREAVYDVIARRRDIRNFRPDPVADDVLYRILGAAHQAGSVGFMQPWDFIVVRREETRRRAYEAFRAANERAARHYEDDRAVAYGALKLQGVLDAPLAICVTCDTLRGGPHVLGRDTIPEMDRYSTCLAVQNLWLAARAEGVGVGWVSIVEPAELVSLFGLPDGVVPIAYLCVGYPVVFPESPMLSTTGWRQRLPLDAVVHDERWAGGDVRATHGAERPVEPLIVLAEAPFVGIADVEAAQALIAATLAHIARPDADGVLAAAAERRLDSLARPLGSLGAIETLAVRMARAQGTLAPRASAAHLLLFAGDHGVAVHGVSAYRAEVTTKLCYTVLAGGAVCSALAREAGVGITLVDVGVDHAFDAGTALVHRKVRRGTRDLSVEPALTRNEVLCAMAVGIASVTACADAQPVLLGEIGIGNTTSAAAIAALVLGLTADETVGAGTGVGAQASARKRRLVALALARARLRADVADPVTVLAEVGGLEIAAITGAVLACAASGRVAVLDGAIVCAAALVAHAMAPCAMDYCVAAHVGGEPGHSAMLQRMALRPLLNLELRLGEGSGALLAMPLLRASCALLTDVRSWEETGIAVPADLRGLE